MHSTYLRREHIHGLMVGCAVGDALGFAREGLSKRQALRAFGKPKLRFELVPRLGIYSDDTQLMLMAAQAILNSRSESRFFRPSFQWRLSWYLTSLPIGIGRATLLAGLKSWFYRLGLKTGVNSAGNGAATRSIFLALAINGAGHRLSRWIDDSTRLTHTHPMAVDGCQVLAVLADSAATIRAENFDSAEILDKAIEASCEPELKRLLEQLKPFLADRRSPTAVARHFGWERGISGYILPTTVMSTYCWLRNPTDFQRAVSSAVGLGGDSDSLAAIVGGLVGAHIGFSKLPENLVRRLAGSPQDRQWIAKLADRLSHWPHGVNDLHSAPAQGSAPPIQLARNSLVCIVVVLHLLLRLPLRLSTR